MASLFNKVVSQPGGWIGRNAARAYDLISPEGSSRDIAAQKLYNVSSSISDPNQVYQGGGIDGQASWTQVNPTSSSITAVGGVQNSGQTPQNEDPYGNNGGSGGYGGGSGGSGTFDPNSIYEANDIISQASNILSRLPGRRETGRSNIAGTYGSSRSKLQNDFGRNEADYNQNRTSTIRDNEVAKNGIDRRVAARTSGLQRFIGSRGGGNSEAALRLAPYAVARTGTQDRAQVNQKFGANLSGLDQNFGRYKDDFTNSINDLGSQENNAYNDLETQLLQQEYGARDNERKGRAALAYAQNGDAASARALRDQAQPGLYAILQQIDALSKQNINPNVQDASYTAPELSQYTTEGAQDIGGISPQLGESISPFYQNYLLRKQQEDQGFFGY